MGDKSIKPEEETQTDDPVEVSGTNSSPEDSVTKDSSEDQTEEDWLDILGNGQLKKKIIKKGKSNTRPNKRDICTIKIIGMLEDGTVAEEHDDLVIQVGDLEVVQGLDLTIVLMDTGEVAEILVNSRFAYGTNGAESIPPNATIKYTVELKEVEFQPDIVNMSTEQRRKISNKKRERGNWWFIRKDIIFALQCYESAMEYLSVYDNMPDNYSPEEINAMDDGELQAVLDDRIKIYNNMAAALMEKEDYYQALHSIDQVLKYQPKNVKALYRRAKIFKLRKEHSKAYMAFRNIQKLHPESKSLNAELMGLKNRISRESEKEKHLYRKMLGIGEWDVDEPSKDVTAEDKSKITKGLLWTLIGASAAVVGILVHRFVT